MFEQVMFWLFGAGAVVTAGMVVAPPFNRNPVHAALALIASFFCMAGLYMLLLAHLLAVLQILVYAGAIMVLFLFVIMLLNLGDHELGKQSSSVGQMIGLVAMAFVTSKLVVTLATSADSLPHGADPAAPEALVRDGFGTVATVGDAMFRHYLVPFELTAILLLIAVIGAVVLAKRNL
ncbi:MAG: NADH-quinone oxidoreductase subunit J [Deltaproteobacteria bacterium]|nr:NADH-quinone oxidoreductase subunit J [Deltaproteobacteria bacterium]MCB9785911.1 NADH-quinone oxidoreductase subunit J [Deltaproteobacteria bacterium]